MTWDIDNNCICFKTRHTYEISYPYQWSKYRGFLLEPNCSFLSECQDCDTMYVIISAAKLASASTMDASHGRFRNSIQPDKCGEKCPLQLNQCSDAIRSMWCLQRRETCASFHDAARITKCIQDRQNCIRGAKNTTFEHRCSKGF